MTLGVISSSYPRSPGDYAGAFVRRALLDARDDRGISATVVAPGLCRDVSDRGIRVVSSASPGSLFAARGAPTALRERPLAASVAAVPALASMVWTALRATRDAAGLVGHWLAPGGAIAAMIRGRRPVGVVVHSTAARWFLALPDALRAPFRALFRDVSWVTATTHALAGQLAAALGRAVDVAPPAIALQLMRDIPPPMANAEVLTLGFIGRDIPGKGRAYLHAIAARLEAAGVAHRWMVAGPGCASPPPRTQVRGVLDHRDVPGFLAELDALVLPSGLAHAEGVPCVMLEGLVARRPVFGFPSGGIAEWLPEAWRARGEDPIDLADRIALAAGSRSRMLAMAHELGRAADARLEDARGAMSDRLAALAMGRGQNV